jgi:hypothetical protein
MGSTKLNAYKTFVRVPQEKIYLQSEKHRHICADIIKMYKE